MKDIPKTMKAAYFKEYGEVDNIEIRQVPVPNPKEDEVLIRNHASSINFGNHGHIVGKPLFIKLATGLFKPKTNIPGGDVAGEVVAIGQNVRDFKVGDRVITDTADSGMSAYAEYVVAAEDIVVKIPEKITFEEAASLPLAASVAMKALKDKCKLKEGDKILIVGSTGGVGAYAVQIAKALGAEVTAVCSKDKAEFVKSLGADRVIDYKSQDFVNMDDRYDIVAGVSGFRTMKEYKKVLKPNGTYINIGGNMKQFSNAFMTSPFLFAFSKKKFIMFLYMADKNTMQDVIRFLDAGKIKPLVDRVFKLKDIVPALKYYESGDNKSKIIIEI